MKDRHTVGKKWPEMVVKLAIVIVIRFYSDYTLEIFWLPKPNFCRVFDTALVHPKGQFFSKGLIGILGFTQKTNKRIRF